MRRMLILCLGLTALGCTPQDDAKTGDSGPVLDDDPWGGDPPHDAPAPDTAIALFWWTGSATATPGLEFDAEGRLSSFGIQNELERCAWSWSVAEATPAADCEQCDWAFHVTWEAPGEGVGPFCELDLSGLEGAQWGVGYASSQSNFFLQHYGVGTGDFVWYYPGYGWYTSYLGYAYEGIAPTGDYELDWGQYYGSYYYYL